MPLRRVAVIAGSEAPSRPENADAAVRVGRLLAENGITLLAGDVAAGLTATLTASAREAGGVVVEMARDAVLVDKADAFFALPQGLASLEELFELWSWRHPGDPEKPSGLLDVSGYFTGLLRNESDAALERFVRETQRGMLIVDTDPVALLRAMADFRPPETRRLFPRDEP